MAEGLADAVESKNKKVALIIAILALFLALAEAGGKNAQHRSTEHNIEASDLYSFYQAKKIRSSIAESAAAALEVNRLAVADPKVQEAMDKQIEVWKGTVTRLEKDPKTPQDSMEAILERAKAASEGRELSNHRLEHYELSSGLLQIAIVLASAAIITGIAALIWLSVGLGVIGAGLMAFGFLAPTVLPFLGSPLQ
jgi:Domain of unknown function (DUF4337)